MFRSLHLHVIIQELSAWQKPKGSVLAYARGEIQGK